MDYFLKITLSIIIAQTSIFSSAYAEYEPYEGPEHDYHPQNYAFDGLRLIELYFPEPQTAQQNYEGYRPRVFSGYTLLLIEDSPNVRKSNRPVALQAIEKILNALEKAYLNVHRQKGKIPKEMLDSVSDSAERFYDGRSVYTVIIKGRASDVVQWSTQNTDFPSDVFRASLRFSKASFEQPQLPFAINLNLPNDLFTNTDGSIDLKESLLTFHNIVSSPNTPTSLLETTVHNISFSRGVAIGGANEIKAFMIRPEINGPFIDWMPYLVQFIESQGLNSRSGYFFDRKTGQAVLQGSPLHQAWMVDREFEQDYLKKSVQGLTNEQDKIRFRQFYEHKIGEFGQSYSEAQRFGPIFAEYFFAEVLESTEGYLNFIESQKPTGLLKMYLKLGFEIDPQLTKPHPQFPELTIVVLQMSYQKWSQAVSNTTKRPGMKTLRQTIEHIRSFPLILEQMNREIHHNQWSLCSRLY